MLKNLGYSAFTTRPDLKARIRPLLEIWGDVNWTNIYHQFFSSLLPPAVNTRLCRVDEAREWVKRGGIIVEVIRRGVDAETLWAQTTNQTLHETHLIHMELLNNGTREELQEKVRSAFL